MRILSSIIVITTLFLFGCADLNSGITAPPPDRVTYVDDIQPILDRQCSRCHGVNQTIGGLDLTRYDSILASDDFVPGDPNSIVLLKLRPSSVSIRSMYIYLNDVHQYNLIYRWVVEDSLARE